MMILGLGAAVLLQAGKDLVFCSVVLLKRLGNSVMLLLNLETEARRMAGKIFGFSVILLLNLNDFDRSSRRRMSSLV